MSLKQDIGNWDKGAVEDLELIYDRRASESELGSETVKLLIESSVQQGASWLLKRYLETDGELSTADLGWVFESLSHLEEWGSKLHLLQCLSYLTIGKSDVKILEPFLRACLEDENKFVRAWAYNGFYELALQHSQFKDEVDRMLEHGMQVEAASVKARIRNIRKDSK
ncbi:MAG: hypothetical protein QM501_11685 [Gimesia sp.]